MSTSFLPTGFALLRSCDDLASTVDQFDRDCRRFFHESPPALKALCRSFFPRDGEHDRSSSAGYLEAASGTGEMFILRFPTYCDEDVPWPAAPKTFVSNAKRAADALQEAAVAALCDALVSAFEMRSVGDASGVGGVTPVDIETWVRGLPFHEQSIVFCRHYLAKGCNDISGRALGVLAHTDSGILTVVAARQSDLSFLEFLGEPSGERLHGCPPKSEADASVDVAYRRDALDEPVGCVAFFGEAAIPFVQLCATSLGLLLPEAALSRFRAAVHQVRHERWSASQACRHSFSLQMRLPLDVLLPSSATARPTSTLTHRMLAL